MLDGARCTIPCELEAPGSFWPVDLESLNQP